MGRNRETENRKLTRRMETVRQVPLKISLKRAFRKKKKSKALFTTIEYTGAGVDLQDYCFPNYLW